MTERLVLHTRVVTGTGGGPDKTILNSPRYLRGSGYPMICAYMRHPGDTGFAELETRAAEMGVELLPVDDFGPLDWRLPSRLLRICRDRQPIIWHGHDYKSNLMGLLVRRSYAMRLVTTVHGWVKRTRRTPLYYAIDRYCLKRYDHVICVSQDLLEQCRQAGVPANRCVLIPNAIDTEQYRRRMDLPAAKSLQGVEPDRLLIGAVGRLSPEKGFDLLIKAVHRLRRLNVNCELWIAGEGEEQNRLARLITELDLDSSAKLLGFVSDTQAFYDAIDIYVLSSFREGLPNSVLEAMAHEVPVLATRVGGMPSLICDGDNGLLIDSGSVDALATGLDRLIGDAKLRVRLGRQAQAAIQGSHSYTDRMHKVKGVYDQLFDARERV